MTRPTRQRRFHFKSVRPRDPAVKPLDQWMRPNRGFYARFRRWLQEGAYSDSAIKLYGTAARLALGWLDVPYWEIDPIADLDRVREYIVTHFESQATRETYLKGIAELADFLWASRQRTRPERPINWQTFVGPLPGWLAADVRAYLAHRRRSWPLERQREATRQFLSHLTKFLRWAAEAAPLVDIGDFTPDLWFAYLDQRLAAGISATTVNHELIYLQGFLRFLADRERPICRRMLRVEPLKKTTRLPRDVPLDQLQRLRREIEADATSDHAGVRRMGVMDRAWFLLMLHSGLRTCEVRCLRMDDLDVQQRRVRVEQSKDLKDRIVCLSRATLAALQAYLEIRGPATSEHVFVYRHAPLSRSYCGKRLGTYGKRCGIHVTPHQLRHTCATLLLNAGAPIVTVQTILGHRRIDTTLTYARLYDGTVAAQYYRAMDVIERRMRLEPGLVERPPTGGQLLALVDALGTGTLNENQRDTVHALRVGILALIEPVDEEGPAHCDR